MAAYTLINFWLLKGLSCDLSGDLFDLFDLLGGLLSSYIRLYSRFFRYKTVPARGAYTTHNNYINGILIHESFSQLRSAIIGGYFDSLNGYCNGFCYEFNFGFDAVLLATAVIGTITTRICFDNRLFYTYICGLKTAIIFGYLAALSATTTATEIGFDNNDIVDALTQYTTGIAFDFYRIFKTEIPELNEYEYNILKSGNEINTNTNTIMLNILNNEYEYNVNVILFGLDRSTKAEELLLM